MGISDDLLLRGDDQDRPSLEGRVAYQWDSSIDTLRYRSGGQRDRTILGWAVDCIADSRPATVVDIGSAYGNLLFMLNAMLDKDNTVELVGLDIDERGLAYGRAFAQVVAGYSNCQFTGHDVTTRLPFTDSSVDLVLAADVLEHLPDVQAVLQEIRRVLRPSGALILSTPLADSHFKRLAALVNRVSAGRVNRAYYRGKGSDVDEAARPIMAVNAGHDHISEMNYANLMAVLQTSGFRVRKEQLSPVMSGSSWFDQHPMLLSALIAIEALHSRLKRPAWAHGIVLEGEPAD